MSLLQPDKNLVNRFLNNELSGIELENFRERMLTDDQFKHEVNFQSLLRSGILFSKEEDLKKKIIERIKYRKARIPFALKLIFTFLIVTGFGITLWFYVGTESADHHKTYSFFSFSSKEKEKKGESKSSEKNKSAENSENKNQPVNGERKTIEQSGENNQEIQHDQNQTAKADSTVAPENNEEEIVVKKEQLIISVSIPVIDKPVMNSKTTDATQNNTLSHDAAEKLNPSAGIPEEEKAATNYMVEFWVSPINYRGYKMSKNKLIIYGIEEPDAVKLYRLNDALFMKYHNEYYRLSNTFEYIPYQRMKETDVPLAIRQ